MWIGEVVETSASVIVCGVNPGRHRRLDARACRLYMDTVSCSALAAMHMDTQIISQPLREDYSQRCTKKENIRGAYVVPTTGAELYR
jgi:hypothetical protein